MGNANFLSACMSDNYLKPKESNMKEHNASTQRSIATALSTSSETNELLNERGERLSRLSNKSESLSSQSSEYVLMARQLRMKQKSRKRWV